MKAVAKSSTAVTPTWIDTNANESGYKIEYKLYSSSSWPTYKTVGANVETFTVENLYASTPYKNVSVAASKSTVLLENLDGATTYSIRVKADAVSGDDDSDDSATVKAKTWRKIAPPTITDVELGANALVKWSKVYGAASYAVVCAPVGAADAKTISATFAASKSQGLFNVLRPETKYSITVTATYTIRVKAVGEGGCADSGYSNLVGRQDDQIEIGGSGIRRARRRFRRRERRRRFLGRVRTPRRRRCEISTRRSRIAFRRVEISRKI